MKGAAITLAGVAAMIVSGAWVFSAVEHLGFGLSVYYVIATASTVGYGDITPHTTAGRVVASVLMLTTIPLLAAAFARLSAEHAARVAHRKYGAEMMDHAIAARQIAADLYRHHTGREHPESPIIKT